MDTAPVPADRDLRDYGWAPGGYSFHCKDCGGGLDFHNSADKRSTRCRDCAVKAWESAIPDRATAAVCKESAARYFVAYRRLRDVSKASKTSPGLKVSSDLIDAQCDLSDALKQLDRDIDQATWDKAGRLYAHGKPGLKWLWDHECYEVRWHYAEIVLGYEDAMA
jgi:hypothetical protein